MGLQKGYIVYTDNFYSSPALFKALTDSGFQACGTARKDRRGIPKSVSTANLQKGEIQSTRYDGILSLKWTDKRDVLMLSTFHDDTMVGKSRHSRTAVGGVETIQKPRVVEEYNQFMVSDNAYITQCIIYLYTVMYIPALFLQVIRWWCTMAFPTSL